MLDQQEQKYFLCPDMLLSSGRFPTLLSVLCVWGKKCLPESTLQFWVESQEPQRLLSTLVLEALDLVYFLPLDRGFGSPRLAGATADDSLDYCCRYMWNKGISSHKWVPTVATAIGHCHWVSGFLLNLPRVFLSKPFSQKNQALFFVLFCYCFVLSLFCFVIIFVQFSFVFQTSWMFWFADLSAAQDQALKK